MRGGRGESTPLSYSGCCIRIQSEKNIISELSTHYNMFEAGLFESKIRIRYAQEQPTKKIAKRVGKGFFF
jgi:hypothetical protein